MMIAPGAVNVYNYSMTGTVTGPLQIGDANVMYVGEHHRLSHQHQQPHQQHGRRQAKPKKQIVGKNCALSGSDAECMRCSSVLSHSNGRPNDNTQRQFE